MRTFIITISLFAIQTFESNGYQLRGSRGLQINRPLQNNGLLQNDDENDGIPLGKVIATNIAIKGAGAAGQNAVDEQLTAAGDAVESTIEQGQQFVNDTVSTATSMLNDTIVTTQETVGKVVDKAEETIGNTIEKGQEAVNATVEAVKGKVEESLEVAETIANAAAEAADMAVSTVAENTQTIIEETADELGIDPVALITANQCRKNCETSCAIEIGRVANLRCMRDCIVPCVEP